MTAAYSRDSVLRPIALVLESGAEALKIGPVGLVADSHRGDAPMEKRYFLMTSVPEANRMFTRAYRAPFVVPEKV